MRRIPAAALAAALLLTALALAGCASWLESPNKPANDAIALANTHLEKAMLVGKSITDAGARLDSIPYTKDGAKSALEITAKIKADLATQKAELLAAKTAMDSMASMEVSDELKQYAKLESVALETRVKVTDAGVALYAQMDAFYTPLASGKTAKVNAQEILDGIDSAKRDITALSDLAAQQAQDATDYFKAQKLGE